MIPKIRSLFITYKQLIRYFTFLAYISLSLNVLIQISSDDSTKLRHCLLLIGRFDFVTTVQKIVQSFRRILYLFHLRIVVFNLRLLLNVVIVPNIVELVHLYNLLLTCHILVDIL